jgi:hypothetical protein
VLKPADAIASGRANAKGTLTSEAPMLLANLVKHCPNSEPNAALLPRHRASRSDPRGKDLARTATVRLDCT